MRNLPHLAARLFNSPLMVEARKLEVITSVFMQRIGVEGFAVEVPEKTAMYGEKRDRKPYAVSDGGVAIIDVCGSLVNRSTGMEAWSGMSSYEQLSYEVLDAATDPNIKGILMRFDSPGGETSGAFDLADMVAEAAKQKPTWASVDDNCYSAAYLMASQCSKIYVTQTGGVGSVGVIAMHMDQSGFDKEIGLKFTTLYAGDRKNDFNPHEPLKKEASEWLQAEIDTLYGMFTKAVAKGRNMSVSAVKATQAGLFSGQNGIEIGFADEIGTFRDALNDISAAINGAPKSSGSTASAAAEITPKQENKQMDEKTLRAEAEPTAAEMPMDDDEKKKKDEEEDMKTKSATSAPASTAAAPATPLATAEEIMDLCEIAGQPLALARQLMGEKLTLAAVRAKVIEAKASTQAPPTRSTVAPKSIGTESIMSAASELAKQQPNLSKEQHFARLLKANPHAYAEYLAANPAQTGRA